MTFTVVPVPLSYLLNMFYCTNVTNENMGNKLAAETEETRVFSSDFCSTWGVISPDFTSVVTQIFNRTQ